MCLPACPSILNLFWIHVVLVEVLKNHVQILINTLLVVLEILNFWTFGFIYQTFDRFLLYYVFPVILEGKLKLCGHRGLSMLPLAPILHMNSVSSPSCNFCKKKNTASKNTERKILPRRTSKVKRWKMRFSSFYSHRSAPSSNICSQESISWPKALNWTNPQFF